MSVVYDFGDGALDVADEVLEWVCTECADPLTTPFVYWRGASLLFFHPACAAHLGPHLIADAREATLAANPAPHWRRRLIDAVRSRLQGEEVAA